jgi:hypothetical protein
MSTQVFTFAELSDSAKKYAREQYREHNLDYEWWDFVYEDAKTIGKLFGLEINDMCFSGFWSQGDGVAFNASYQYRKGGLKAVMQYAPQDNELHGIVARLQTVQRKAFYRLYASCEQTRGNNIRVNVDNDSRDITESEEDSITLELNYFADWIYSRLESEYEYLQSDEVIDESMVANEYEFTANGEMI